MTVCFEFDPKKEPWITPFDRRDTRNNPEPDGKISTYDLEAAPHDLSRYGCDGIYVEMVKFGFFNQIIKPQAEQGAALWKDRTSYYDWRSKIWAKYNEAMDAISQRQIQNDPVKGPSLKIRDDMQVCDFMGSCVENMFAAAKHFIDCASDEAEKSLKEKTPILAGIGIALKREPGRRLPSIDYVIPQAASIFSDLGLNLQGANYYVASIDGKSTKTMTEEQLAAALSGFEGTYVGLEIAIYEDSNGKKTRPSEPKVIRTGFLKHELSLGPIMIQCGGIDL